MRLGNYQNCGLVSKLCLENCLPLSYIKSDVSTVTIIKDLKIFTVLSLYWKAWQRAILGHNIEEMSDLEEALHI